MKIKIAPSILSADKKKLQEEIEGIEEFADLIHVDIMDGKFVPPITFDSKEIGKIKSKLPKDVHLMVEYPLTEGFIDDYIAAGAASITIHEEAKDDIDKCIEYIKGKGINVGISINPSSSLDNILSYLDKVDMVLIMSVNPGYAGQKFISSVLDKVKRLRELKPDLDIEIDGGINKDTIKQVVDAGANVIVAGSAIFDQENRKGAIRELRDAFKS